MSGSGPTRGPIISQSDTHVDGTTNTHTPIQGDWTACTLWSTWSIGLLARKNCVVLQITPPAVVQGKPRPRFPEESLEDVDAMLQLEAFIAQLPESDPDARWGAALNVISMTSKCWARELSTRSFSHLEAILTASAPT